MTAEGPEFAIFLRSDAPIWQGISGGGEDGEAAHQAARRESFEEARIPLTTPLCRLTSTCYLPARAFNAPHWPDDLYVIPEFSFTVDASMLTLQISREHREYAWLAYAEAHQRVTFDNCRTALWELNQRIARDDLR
jgi:dATP pyrophosphohydrolase